MIEKAPIVSQVAENTKRASYRRGAATSAKRANAAERLSPTALLRHLRKMQQSKAELVIGAGSCRSLRQARMTAVRSKVTFANAMGLAAWQAIRTGGAVAKSLPSPQVQTKAPLTHFKNLLHARWIDLLRRFDPNLR